MGWSSAEFIMKLSHVNTDKVSFVGLRGRAHLPLTYCISAESSHGLHHASSGDKFSTIVSRAAARRPVAAVAPAHPRARPARAARGARPARSRPVARHGLC